MWNCTYLLAWAARDPEGVVLLRGNHEATRQIAVPLPTLARELERLYPPADARRLADRLVDLLERLPLAARTANGVFFSHGGIPPRGQWDPTRWDPNDLRLLEGLLWSDPDLEYEHRPAGFAYSEVELAEFLDALHCRVLVKGHAPNHSGRAIFGGRLLTVHTSDIFSAWGEGGVLLAEVPPHRPVRNADDLSIRAWNGEDWVVRPIRFVPEVTPRGNDPGAAPDTSVTAPSVPEG